MARRSPPTREAAGAPLPPPPPPAAPAASGGSAAHPLSLLIRTKPGILDLEASLRRDAERRERALALRLWLSFFTPRGLRRLVHYVVGSVLVLPLLHVALTPVGWADLDLLVATSVAFAIVMALARPRGIVVGFLLAGAAFGTVWVAGYVHSLVDVLHLVLALLCYFGFGLALGISENVVRHGE